MKPSAGISVLGWSDLTDAQRESASAYFRRNVLPILTPLAVDPGHPFPFLSNLSLNLAIEVKNPKGRVGRLDPKTGEMKEIAESFEQWLDQAVARSVKFSEELKTSDEEG